MYFSADAIAEMAAAYQALDEKEDALVSSFITRKFKNDIAKEFAQHGVARRLRTLTSCIKNVFNALPPESDTLPGRNDLIDATINIQAFIINAAGLLDNLAWVWVHENDVRNYDGSALKKLQISLTNKVIRQTFSTEFQNCIQQNRKWIKNLRTFRDPLAHRIPLYISPYQVPVQNTEKYLEIDRQKTLTKTNEEWEKLDAEQKKLVVFQPHIRHSLFEKGGYSLVFHPQLFADFHTIEEISYRLLGELDAPFNPQSFRGNIVSRLLKRWTRALANFLSWLAR